MEKYILSSWSGMLASTNENLVKQDMNFLEFPLWVVGKQKKSGYVISTDNGTYSIQANEAYGIPDSLDALILYYFLFVAQNTNCAVNQYTYYNICKNLQMSVNKRSYERIKKSLDKWLGVTIKFDGVFYEDKERRQITEGFNILTYRTETSGKKSSKGILSVELNREFFNTIQNSTFFKNIDLNFLIALKKPLARRLAEYLMKQFLKSNTHTIGHIKLFNKLTLEIQKYLSEIERRIKSIQKTLDDINKYDKKYSYSMSFKLNKNKEFIIVFTRSDKKNNQIEIDENPNQTSLIDYEGVNNNIITPLKEFGFRDDDINRLLKEYDSNVLQAVIQELKFIIEVKKTKVPSPAGYFTKLLPSPGKPFQNSKQYLKHQEELKKIKVHQKYLDKQKRHDKEKEKRIEETRILNEKVDKIYSSLPLNERESIKNEALKVLKGRGISKEYITDIGVTVEIRKIVKQKYDIRL